MKKQLLWLIPVSIALLLLAGYYGERLYRELTASVQVEVAQGPITAEAVHLVPPPIAEEEMVAQRLLNAGLNDTPVLGDTAVSGHIQRLEEGEVSEATLLTYADDLEYLNHYTADNNGRIPTSFWDVRTPEMEANHWDEYSVVHQMTQPDSEPYLRLLTRGYGRFTQFKTVEALGSDAALDAALDMFAYVKDYYDTVPYAALTEHAPEIESEADELLMIWQSLVAGSTRINPLTHKPMFSHSIFVRDNVGTMYQYEIAKAISIAEVWGVTGFAPHFVGVPENNNQIEHMSISMVLQMILDEPVLVLDGIEEEKTLAGHADSGEANADMALNNAIHREFKPHFAEDWEAAVERLRRALKADRANLNNE